MPPVCGAVKAKGEQRGKMAKKYIDAGKFVGYFGDWYTEEGTESGFIGTIKDLVEQIPAADVVEVVRCKDCKYRDDDFCIGRGFPNALVPDDGFCDKGERRG